MALDAVSSLLGGGGSSDAQPPAVYAPRFAISVGSGDPAAWQGQTLAVVVEAGLVPAVDIAEIYVAVPQQPEADGGLLGAAAGAAASAAGGALGLGGGGDDSGGLTAALGDAVTVSAGYADSPPTLFTGTVSAVRYDLEGIMRVTASNGGALLSRARLTQSYEQQAAGDIVSDLAGSAGASTGTIEAGVQFPFYVVDSGLSALRHIAALARKCNFISYFDTDGALHFKPFAAGEPVRLFAYGSSILSLSVTEAAPLAGAVTLTGEGAAGSEGSEAWSWPIQDASAVQGSAGDGDPARSLDDASLRSGDAATSAAEGFSAAAAMWNLTGTLTTPGAPEVVTGSVIEISGAPQASLNGQMFVRRVRHVFSLRRGFTTRIDFSSVGAIESAGGGLLDALGGLL